MEKDLLERKEIQIYSLADFWHQKRNAYELLQSFKCKKAPSLQQYLIDDAVRDEALHKSKTYIVFNEKSDILVAYFSIRATCLIHKIIQMQGSEKLVQNIIPCIEITKFCVNDSYRKLLKENGYSSNNVGKYVFDAFIVPILVLLSEKVGFETVVLFAINDEEGKVIKAYREHMGFESVEDDDTKLISLLENITILVDEYSSECKFLFQELSEIIRKFEGGYVYA